MCYTFLHPFSSPLLSDGCVIAARAGDLSLEHSQLLDDLLNVVLVLRSISMAGGFSRTLVVGPLLVGGTGETFLLKKEKQRRKVCVSTDAAQGGDKNQPLIFL